MHIAIDPGADTGVAVLNEKGVLVDCWVGHPLKGYHPGITFLNQGFKSAIIEKPQIYSPKHSKGNPNDLIPVAVQAGGYEALLRHFGTERVTLILPHDWKGTIDKSKHHERIWGQLSATEQDLVARRMAGVAVSKRHNAMDAVGLAKFAWNNGLF